jgi:sigma54-dependent transcription regulator
MADFVVFAEAEAAAAAAEVETRRRRAWEEEEGAAVEEVEEQAATAIDRGDRMFDAPAAALAAAAALLVSHIHGRRERAVSCASRSRGFGSTAARRTGENEGETRERIEGGKDRSVEVVCH